MHECAQYAPKHARHADPAQLSEYMRGLANLIEIVPSEDE
jgi:hypothetical protein